MEKYDIVYVLKNHLEIDELIYSLRSVVLNFPYNKIYFYGGSTCAIKPDVQVEYQQIGNTKAERVINTLVEVCKNDDITENFWLFNDDFFILNKVSDYTPMYDGRLPELANRIESSRGKPSLYTNRVRKTNKWLLDNDYNNLNYCVHTPMLINRKQALPILKEFKNHNFRALYGNIYSIVGVDIKDVKIVKINEDIDKEINSVYLSTKEKSFNKGLVGKRIREMFPNKCKYEL